MTPEWLPIGAGGVESRGIVLHLPPHKNNFANPNLTNYLYSMRHRSHHHAHGETIRVLINGKLSLTLKHYKMQTISINVDDNQADLDALKSQAQAASDALTAAITQLETVSAALTAFQITFTASVAPSA